MPVLKIEKLQKVFSSGWWAKKHFTAVNGISFELHAGEILGFLGPNGAGKTTTIEMLLGTLTPTAGYIEYFGKDFKLNRSETMQKVTFASAYVRLPSRMTVWQNLDIFGRLYGVRSPDRYDRIKRFLTLFGMWDMSDKITGSLSAGQMTRVMLAKAFVPHPDIVLLDEPTASLDPDVAQEVRTFVLQQKEEQGTAILFTSHNMHEVTQVCDRVLVLQHGTIIADSTPWDLAASVANVTIHLTMTDGLKRTIDYAQQQAITFKLIEREIQLEVDEDKIADLLIALAHLGAKYSQISIDKPTLEDYFMSLVQKKNKE